jgi:hypothetical protein
MEDFSKARYLDKELREIWKTFTNILWDISNLRHIWLMETDSVYAGVYRNIDRIPDPFVRKHASISSMTEYIARIETRIVQLEECLKKTLLDV